MSTILKNVLRFTGLAVNTPVSLPHLININQLALAPQLVLPRTGGVTVTADTVNVTATRLIGGPADVDVYCERWHSYESALPPGALSGLVPFLLDPGVSGPGGSSNVGSNCLMFMPGSGQSGPVVFDDWNDLMTQLTALRAVSNGSGCFTISVDNSLIFPAAAVVPPGGPYDFNNVFLIGNYQVPQIAPTVNRLDVSDGATFIGLRNIQTLHLVNFNTITPMDSTLGMAPTDGEIIRVSVGSILENVGAAPMWRIVPGGVGAIAILISDLMASAGAIIDLPTAGTILATAVGAGSRVEGSSFTGVVGSFLQLGRQAAGATMASTYPGFAGSLFVSASGWTDSAILRPKPFGGAPFTGNTTAEYGDFTRCDTSGGGFTVQLPRLSAAVTAADFNPGCINTIGELSGSPGLLVAPNAGDTINGAGAAIAVNAGGAVMLVNDGFSDWKLISSV